MKNNQAQLYKAVTQVHGLSVGTKAPLFIAIDQDNAPFDLSEALKDKPVVLVFYRGFWCPYCNKHLKNLQDSLGLIKNAGAQVIAISPEKPEYLQKMKHKSSAQFTLLFDDSYRIAKAYDVNFRPTKTERLKYNSMVGAKLKKTHSDESEQLPVPATYVINKSGIIIWKQFDPNYKIRSSVADILKALENAK